MSTQNAILYTEGDVKLWKQDIGSESLDNAIPGVISYLFNFDKKVGEARIFIRTSTYHWAYSKGHSFIYASNDGSNWINLVEAAPPDYGQANTQLLQSIPASLLGSKSLWFKVELYSYGSSAVSGGAMTNTAQHSRYSTAADNTTFQLDIKFSQEPDEPPFPDVIPDESDPTPISCVAEFQNGLFAIPCIQLGNDLYRMEFNLVDINGMPALELVNFTPRDNVIAEPACKSLFLLNTLELFVPCIDVGNNRYVSHWELSIRQGGVYFLSSRLESVMTAQDLHSQLSAYNVSVGNIVAIHESFTRVTK